MLELRTLPLKYALTGKYMFVEYSWNIPMMYFQNIRKKFPYEIPGNIPK